MTTPRFIFQDIAYNSQVEPPATLRLRDGLNIIYGASNTGKTFFLKSLDFMLGSSGQLPEIDERNPFDQILLNVQVDGGEDFVLRRAIVGGSFEVSSPTVGANSRKLSARHKAEDDNNLSNFLLGVIGLTEKRIAKDANGNQRSLSFRDLVRYGIVDETTIQSETSPFESGQHTSRTEERSVLKLLLTGQDDSAIVPLIDRKTFRTSRAARLAVIEDMLVRVNEELEADYPDIDDIEDQDARLEATFNEMQTQLKEAEQTITSFLRSKRESAVAISSKVDRLGQIRLNLARFSQLHLVYQSDIRRLESLEETAFLLTLGGDKACPLCGAPPDAQEHKHAVTEIGDSKAAAIAEIGKISALDADLARTVIALEQEQAEIENELPKLRQTLQDVEKRIALAAPETINIRQRMNELLPARDQVKHGLELLKQRRDYEIMREEVSSEREPTSAEKPKLGVPGTVAHEYGQFVSRILQRWHFPGQCHVAFDDDTYDLRIDGKLRRANGKGVRAITHAAMKVAMLDYCHSKDLPHPGFLVLDTPLLTYRDPLVSRAGELAQDEAELAQSTLKDHFFEHLLELQGTTQTIILENVDPSPSVAANANTIVFSGRHGTGRFGLFPKRIG